MAQIVMLAQIVTMLVRVVILRVIPTRGQRNMVLELVVSRHRSLGERGREQRHEQYAQYCACTALNHPVGHAFDGMWVLETRSTGICGMCLPGHGSRLRNLTRRSAALAGFARQPDQRRLAHDPSDDCLPLGKKRSVRFEIPSR
jgi:hypothetical protein